MYGLVGERRLREWEADWLSYYEGPMPVRIGHAACDLLQNLLAGIDLPNLTSRISR